ncbi:MAG: cbb3-type cytochrome c oxidase subunit I [Thermomicrobiales bacterium]|nr:cbb3-type cytochrome c oxidase subunit I [Thermomicrobiales bacterium]
MKPAAIPRPSGGISSAHAPDLDIPARFMALAMFGLLVTGIIGVVAYPLLLESFYAPKLLAFVHLHTLGIVAPLVVGASYQLVPVVLQEPLAAPRVARFSFWVYLVGVLLFLPSLVATWQIGLGIGGTLLFAALLLYAAIVWMTLASAPERGVIRWHIAAAVVGLPLGVAAGLLLALNKTTGFLEGRTLSLLAAHATLMILCWITPLLFGVAYRLVGMFTLSEDRLWHRVAWAELGFTLVGGWTLATSFLLFHSRPVFIMASALVLIGQALFFVQLAHMYHARRRRQIDVHIPFAMTAASCGVLAGLALFIGFIRGDGPAGELWVVAVWLGIAGMMISAIQGFFYKIATFLVWLNRYAPVAGRQKVPRLEELYKLRVARIGWICWLAALITSASGILLGVDLLVTAGGLLAAGGIGCFLSNVVRIASHWQSGPLDRVIGRMRRSRRAAGGERVGHVIASE